tara:strand:+ start:10392 stop:10655 length:264 start_codon:yes stop_codon:yes gene_type:complete
MYTVYGTRATHLQRIGGGARRGRDRRVECLRLGIVGHLVHRVEEILIGRGHAGQVGEVQRGEGGGGFFLGVAGDAAGDGDGVVGGGL